MAEVAPAKATKKRASKPKNSGPSVGERIVKAVTASKERKGLSLAALKKDLAAGGYDVEKNNARVKNAIKGLVNRGVLVQTKGIGASGSFKLAKKTETKAKKPAKKAAPKAKKPAARKPAAAKKSKAAKKPATAKQSPKKVQKPAAAKKAAKSPKKAKKVVKKAPRKAPAAKKSPAKKAAKPKAKKTAAKQK